jgi:hypothetical protein
MCVRSGYFEAGGLWSEGTLQLVRRVGGDD